MSFGDVVQVFLANAVIFPFLGDFVADGREHDFQNQFRHSPCEGAHCALNKRPAEPIPKDGRKPHEHNHGENQVVQKLSHKGGYVRSARVGKFAVGVALKALAD